MAGTLIWICLHQSCTHDPLFNDIDPDPIDKMDTETTDIGNPCYLSLVYLKNDILPFFVNNCALIGSHDAAKTSNGVILDNYGNIVSQVS